jgi:hypothetical protein
MAVKADKLKIEDQTILLDQYDHYSTKLLCDFLPKLFDQAWHNTVYGTTEQYERLLDKDPLLFKDTEGFVDLQLKE